MQDTDQEQPTIQLETSDDYIPIHERKWKDIIAKEHSHSYKWWETQISKVVSKLVRQECRDRETDGAIHWKVTLPKLVITCRRDGSLEFTDRDGIDYIWKGSSKTRFQYCQNSFDKLCIRAIQGHSEGETIGLEMMGHVCTPLNWKQFFFHRCCSFDLKSILGGGLIAGGREGFESRHAVFFTSLNPWRNEIEEEFHGHLAKPRKVHCKTGWKTLSRRRLLDLSWKGPRERQSAFRKRNRMQSSPTDLCHQTVSSEWSHNAENWQITSDLQHHDLFHQLSLNMPGMISSSKRQAAVVSI